MLDEVPMDGVVISSPHVLHHEHAVAALAKGCHLLVEKPLTTTAADARDLIAKAEAAGKQVIVPYGWNFKDWADEARALVANGRDRPDRACRAADGLCAGGPLRRPADEGDRGAHVPSSAFDLGRSRAGRRLWLGPARACARAFVPHRRSRAVAGLRPHRQVADRRRLLRCCRRAVRQWGDRFASRVRRHRPSTAATRSICAFLAPKACFCSTSNVSAWRCAAATDGIRSSKCRRLRRLRMRKAVERLVDICLGRQVENQSPGTSACAPSRFSMRSTGRRDRPP